MTNGVKLGNVRFLGNVYVLSELVSAFGKANQTLIAENAQFHKTVLDASLLPEEWKASQKLPVVTVHEGKYLFLYRPNDFKVAFDDHTDKSPPYLMAKTAFRAKFVTKYNFNRTKFVEAPAAVDVHRPIYEDRDSHQFTNRPSFRPNQNQNGGGYYNNRRFDERN